MTFEGYSRTGSTTGRRLGILFVVLVVLAGVLLGADSIARSYAENRVASQLQQQGFRTKPTVTIEGFPFLTQALSRDFGEVQIATGSITEGSLEIRSINATLNRVLVNSSFNGGTITSLTGTAHITFPALASAMTSQVSSLSSLANGSLTLSAASSNEVKATVAMDGFDQIAVWRVTVPEPREIGIQLVSGADTPPLSLLRGISSITIPVPYLPMGLGLTSIVVTASGLVAAVTGHNVKFGS